MNQIYYFSISYLFTMNDFLKVYLKIFSGHETLGHDCLSILLSGRSDKSVGRPSEGHSSRCPPETFGQNRTSVTRGLGPLPVHVRGRGPHLAAHLSLRYHLRLGNVRFTFTFCLHFAFVV